MGAVRSSDVNHLDFTSIPLIGLIAVAKTAAEGAQKYGRLNYMQGFPQHDILNHAIAHVVMYLLGDRSEPHLSHAAWGLMAAIQSEVLDYELSQPHMLGPGATLTPEVQGHLDANKDRLAALRQAGEFAGNGNWSIWELPEIQRLLSQRHDTMHTEAPAPAAARIDDTPVDDEGFVLLPFVHPTDNIVTADDF